MIKTNIFHWPLDLMAEVEIKTVNLLGLAQTKIAYNYNLLQIEQKMSTKSSRKQKRTKIVVSQPVERMVNFSQYFQQYSNKYCNKVENIQEAVKISAQVESILAISGTSTSREKERRAKQYEKKIKIGKINGVDIKQKDESISIDIRYEKEKEMKKQCQNCIKIAKLKEESEKLWKDQLNKLTTQINSSRQQLTRVNIIIKQFQGTKRRIEEELNQKIKQNGLLLESINSLREENNKMKAEVLEYLKVSKKGSMGTQMVSTNLPESSGMEKSNTSPYLPESSNQGNLNQEIERLSGKVVALMDQEREFQQIKEQNKVLMMEVEELEEANKRKAEEISEYIKIIEHYESKYKVQNEAYNINNQILNRIKANKIKFQAYEIEKSLREPPVKKISNTTIINNEKKGHENQLTHASQNVVKPQSLSNKINNVNTLDRLCQSCSSSYLYESGNGNRVNWEEERDKINQDKKRESGEENSYGHQNQLETENEEEKKHRDGFAKGWRNQNEEIYDGRIFRVKPTISIERSEHQDTSNKHGLENEEGLKKIREGLANQYGQLQIKRVSSEIMKVKEDEANIGARLNDPNYKFEKSNDRLYQSASNLPIIYNSGMKFPKTCTIIEINSEEKGSNNKGGNYLDRIEEVDELRKQVQQMEQLINWLKQDKRISNNSCENEQEDRVKRRINYEEEQKAEGKQKVAEKTSMKMTQEVPLNSGRDLRVLDIEEELRDQRSLFPIEIIKESIKEIPMEIVKEIIREVPVEIERDLRLVDIEEDLKDERRLFPIKVSVEVIREKVKEIVREIPVEIEKDPRVMDIEDQIKDQRRLFPIKVQVEVVKEIVKEISKEILKEVPVQIERDPRIGDLQQELRDQRNLFPIKVPVEVIREIIKEIPIEVVREVSKEIDRDPRLLDIQEEVKDERGLFPIKVPVEIIKESIKEIPMQTVREIIREVPVSIERDLRIIDIDEELRYERRLFPFKVSVEIPMKTGRDPRVQQIEEQIKKERRLFSSQFPIKIIREMVKEVPVQIERDPRIGDLQQELRDQRKLFPVEVHVETIKEIFKQVPIEILKEVIKEVWVERERDLRLVDIQEELKEERKLFPVKVTIEIVKQIPLEIIKKIQTKIERDSRLVDLQQELRDQRRLFPLEVPVEIIKEVIKEIPMEIVKQIVREIPTESQRDIRLVEIQEELKDERSLFPVKVQVEVIREIIKEIPIEIVKEIIRQVPVEIVKEVPVEVVREVKTQIQVPIQITKQIQIPIYIQKMVQVPVYIETVKQVLKPIEVIKWIDRVVEVPKQIIVEIIKEVQVPKYIQITKQVPVVRQIEVKKQVQVPIYIEIIKQVEVPIVVQKEIQIQKIKEVIVEKEVQVPWLIEVFRQIYVPIQVTKQIQKFVQIAKEIQVPIYIQKRIEVPVEIHIVKQIEVPREIIIEKFKEVPVQVIKEIIKEIPVEVIKEVPVEVIKEIKMEIERDPRLLDIQEELKNERRLFPIKVQMRIPAKITKDVSKEIPGEIQRDLRLQDIEEDLKDERRLFPLNVFVEIEKQVPIQIVKEVIREIRVEQERDLRLLDIEEELRDERNLFPIKVSVKITKEVIKEIPMEILKEVIREVPVEIERVVKEVPMEIERDPRLLDLQQQIRDERRLFPFKKQVQIFQEIIKEVVKEIPIKVQKDLKLLDIEEELKEERSLLPGKVEVIRQIVKEIPIQILKQIIREVPVKTERDPRLLDIHQQLRDERKAFPLKEQVVIIKQIVKLAIKEIPMEIQRDPRIQDIEEDLKEERRLLSIQKIKQIPVEIVKGLAKEISSEIVEPLNESKSQQESFQLSGQNFSSQLNALPSEISKYIEKEVLKHLTKTVLIQIVRSLKEKYVSYLTSQEAGGQLQKQKLKQIIKDMLLQIVKVVRHREPDQQLQLPLFSVVASKTRDRLKTEEIAERENSNQFKRARSKKQEDGNGEYKSEFAQNNTENNADTIIENQNPYEIWDKYKIKSHYEHQGSSNQQQKISIFCTHKSEQNLHQSSIRKNGVRPLEIIRFIEKPVFKEVIKQVEKPVEIIKEVIKEVPIQIVKEIEKPVTIIKEIIREVPVETIKEVIRPIEVIKEVYIQVVKEVEKPIYIVKEVIKEVPLQIVREIEKPIEIIKEVIKEVPIETIKQIEKLVEVIRFVEKPLRGQRFQEDHKSHFETEIPSIPISNRQHGLVTQISDRSAQSHRPQRQEEHFYYGSNMNSPRLIIKENKDDQGSLNGKEGYELKIMSLIEDNEHLKGQLEIMTNTVIFMGEQAQEYKKQIVHLEKKYGEFSNKIEQINEEQKEIDGHNEQIHQQNAKLQTKEIEPKGKMLCNEVESFEEQKKQLQRELQFQQIQITNLQSVLEEKNLELKDNYQMIKALKQAIEESDYRIKNLSHQIQSRHDEIQDYKSRLQNYINVTHEDDEIRRRLDEMQRRHKEEIERLENRFADTLNAYKGEINRLSQEVCNVNTNQNMERAESRQKIGNSFWLKIEDQNRQLRKIVQYLNREIIQLKVLKRKQEVQDKLIRKEEILRDVRSLGDLNDVSCQRKVHEASYPKGKASKIKIESIEGPVSHQGQQQVTRLAKLVQQYSSELEIKNLELRKARKMISYYEHTLKQIEDQTLKRMKEEQRSAHQIQLENKRSYGENRLYHLSTLSITNLINKLIAAQESLNIEKDHIAKCMAKINELEDKLEEYENTQSYPNAYDQDEELLEQVIVELENEKNHNEILKSEVNKLKKQINVPERESQNFVSRESFNAFFNGGDAIDPIEPEIFDNQSLMKELAVYKEKYERGLTVIHQLESQVKRLQQKVRSHICPNKEVLDAFQKKLEYYEKILVPRFLHQIEEYKKIFGKLKPESEELQKELMSNLQKQLKERQKTKSGQKGQNSPQKSPQNSVHNPNEKTYQVKKQSSEEQEEQISIEDILKDQQILEHQLKQTKLEPEKTTLVRWLSKLDKDQQEKKGEQDRNHTTNSPLKAHLKSPSKHKKVYDESKAMENEIRGEKMAELGEEGCNITLSDLMKQQISEIAKYVISQKLIHKMKTILESNGKSKVKTLCPERVMIRNYDPNNLDALEIGRSSMKNKSHESLSLYQAPEILLGQKQNEKSLVWSLGIIIDQLFTGSLFYSKTEDIINPSDNYYYRGPKDTRQIGHIVRGMLQKDKEERSSISQVEISISMLVS